jgi:hypothetical protein
MKKTTDRKRVNFSNFSDSNRALLHDFRTAIIAIAEENARYSSATKPVKTQREKTLALRESAIQDGMSYNDAIIKHSISKEESILAKLKAEHEQNIKDYNKILKACYAFIPEGMYKAYQVKDQTFDDADFNKEFGKFLEGLGIEVGTAISAKWARKLTSAIGVSMATQKTLLTGAESLTKAMSKTMFNKLFMATFIDLFIK